MSYSKRYEGRRWPRGCVVTVNDVLLDPRLDLFNHSPSGFEWAYCGSGPAQLALAILSDHLGKGVREDAMAVRLHQNFKVDVVAKLPHDKWQLTTDVIAGWLAGQKFDDPAE